MDCLEICGGEKLQGSVRIAGAKNSILPILAASILTEDRTRIDDCPFITDVDVMVDILRALGVKTERDGRSISTSGTPDVSVITTELAGRMRSSVFLLGALLARTGQARLALPGGCAIGARPLDIHIDGLKRLGVTFSEEDGWLNFRAERLHGARVKLSYPSVGATENLMMTAVLTEGETILENCAREPEICDLADFLTKMGAKVSGAGTNMVRVQGVKCLHGCDYTPIPDRIVAGTLIFATAITGGEVKLDNVRVQHLSSILRNLPKTACSYRAEYDSIVLCCVGKGQCASPVVTAPYPGFPTDMQAQYLALAACSPGTVTVQETVFESRFGHAAELLKMGADITLCGNVATVRGKPLHGECVAATDLRGGAGLVLAALGASGTSYVSGLEHVDRGYEAIENLISSLGGKVKRIGK